MTVHTIRPVRRQITVEAPQQTAFDVFTRGMGSWWNPDHSLGDRPLVDVVVEPRVGGRWFERDAGGAECPWGTVLVWEPPSRVVLGWQLDGEWTFDPDLVTEVELRFVVEGPTTTRVELEHRDLERLGDHADPARASLAGEGGWSGLLARFARVVTSPA